jgi:hypothetical protein
VVTDFVELCASTGEIRRLVEQDDGWWLFDGVTENWRFSEDTSHGFLTSVDPPDGPYFGLGSAFLTANGRHLIVASILSKGRRLKVILMPEDQPLIAEAHQHSEEDSA